jgi:putative ABC transport system permease protein
MWRACFISGLVGCAVGTAAVLITVQLIKPTVAQNSGVDSKAEKADKAEGVLEMEAEIAPLKKELADFKAKIALHPEVANGKHADERKPDTIVVRSVKLPDDSSAQQRAKVAAYGVTHADHEGLLTIGAAIKSVPMRIFPQEIRYLERSSSVRVVATTFAYADINAIQTAAGRFLNDDDEVNVRRVAVLGSTIADKLFPLADPLKQTVRLGNYFYEVVGIAGSRTPLAADGSSSGESFNNDVYISLKTCQATFGERIEIRQGGERTTEQVQIHQIMIRVNDPEQTKPIADVIRKILKENHEKPD